MFKTKTPPTVHTVTDADSAQHVRARVGVIRQRVATIEGDRARLTRDIGEILATVETTGGAIFHVGGR